MLKRVDVYTDPDDSSCKELMEFLRGLDINLVVRDLNKRPLRAGEVTDLFRHFDMKHFLNDKAKSYKKHNLDKEMPDRQDLYELMANDNDLIKKPVIVSGRLMVIGCKLDKIKEMLQVNTNGLQNVENHNGRSVPRTFRPRA